MMAKKRMSGEEFKLFMKSLFEDKNVPQAEVKYPWITQRA